ncbi:MAG: CotH kinase family protein, partial [Firmicutes bacterium]|nr:CotH kinase family protein [Bacillota bacterium]
MDKQLLLDGMNCSSFEIGREYEYADNESHYTFVFYRSADVPSMFIDTLSDSMKSIHEDNNNEERSDLSVYLPDGSLDSSFSGGSLKGRGNGTRIFGNSYQTKRPYTLKLPAAAEILGMPEASNWVLLANATDETNLRNRIIYEIADEVWPDGGHNSAWVDLYLNGEYSGLYLLSEKAESGENRLDIDLDAGDFLCKIELPRRFEELRNGFFTDCGRAVEVCEPRAMSDTEYNRIISLVNEMEQSLVSGGDLKLKANIDLDSWANRYIIDEISTNIDADSASSYFYYKDGVFYAGPLWDYDLSLGNHFDWEKTDGNPCIFVAKPHNQFSQPGSSYYLSLCDNESFMQRVAELYSQDYMPVLEDLYSGGINELAESIDGALKMDKQRWIANIPYKGESPDDIEKYLAVRSEFLHSAWVDGVKYHSIRVDPAAQNPRFFSVKDGECFDPALLQDYDCLWLDAQTGESYDFSQAVKDDVYIRAQTEAVYYEEENLGDGPNIRETLTVLSIIALLVVFAVLLMVDLRQRRQERKCAKTPAQEISFMHFRSFVKFINKYAYWLAGSILFLLLLLFGLRFYIPGMPGFYIENAYGNEKISI